VQKHVKGESFPVSSYTYHSSQEPAPAEIEREIPNTSAETIEPLDERQPETSATIENVDEAKTSPAQETERKEFSAPFTAWDPSR
jgi:hypothetical protein